MSELALTGILTVVIVGLWATGKLPEYYVALLFFCVAMLTKIAPAPVVFSGFASSAFWLILSGFILAAALRKSGLADWLAYRFLPVMSGSWLRMVAGVVVLSWLLAFLMPSNMARITLLMPVVMALADQAGVASDARGRIGLALAVGLGTFELSASILPANVPNMIMIGAMESGYGAHITYLPYLLLHAPVIGVMKGIVLTFIIYKLFPTRMEKKTFDATSPPLTAVQKRLGAILLVTVMLWVSEGVHGIAPAWVGLGAACLCLLPRAGFLTSEEFAAGVNVRSCIYVAGIIGLTAVVTINGLGDWMGNQLIHIMPDTRDSPFLAYLSNTFIAGALSFAVTANGVPALFTPLAQSLSEITSLPLMTVLMTQVIGYSTPFIPYQAPPLVIAMAIGRVPLREGIRVCTILALVTYLFLVPLNYVWFAITGWI